jgi:hypothetical protein
MTAHELQHGMIKCFSEFYSYTNAIKKTVDAFLDSAMISAKGLYSRVRFPHLPTVKLPLVKLPIIKFPSFKPALLRAGGKQIVNQWVNHNKEYLTYLKRMSGLASPEAETN